VLRKRYFILENQATLKKCSMVIADSGIEVLISRVINGATQE
jgi:hypothetical protein